MCCEIRLGEIVDILLHPNLIIEQGRAVRRQVHDHAVVCLLKYELERPDEMLLRRFPGDRRQAKLFQMEIDESIEQGATHHACISVAHCFDQIGQLKFIGNVAQRRAIVGRAEGGDGMHPVGLAPREKRG